MTHGLSIRPDGALDFLSLGALVHRLDPGIIPFRKASECRIHVSGGEFNCAANLADCFRMKTGIATAMVDYPIGELVAERVRAMGVTPFYKRFAHDGVRGPNIATVYSDRGHGMRAPVVFYNRSNEAAGLLEAGDFDWKAIFAGGVRWFHSGGIFAALSPTTPELITKYTALGAKFETPQQAGLPSQMLNSWKRNLGPRVGFAYQAPGTKFPFVLRGGYSMSYFNIPIWKWNDNNMNNTPLRAQFEYNPMAANQSPDGYSNWLLRNTPIYFDGVNSQNVVDIKNPQGITRGSTFTNYFDPNMPAPTMQSWNLTVEREFFGDYALSLAYVGSKGTKLTRLTTPNLGPNVTPALQIADAGFEVVMVERDSSIGGHMSRFDKTFPTLDCAACILTPKMVSVGKHPNIKLITWAEVEAVKGYIGNFTVKIRRKARYVDPTLCNSCGTCYEACPSRQYPTHRRLMLGKNVFKQGAALEIKHPGIMGPEHDLTVLTAAQPMPEPIAVPVKGGSK